MAKNIIKGQTIIELLVIIGLSAVILPGIFLALSTSREGKAQQSERYTAISLLQETEEAIRTVREAGWNNIATNGNYTLRKTSNNWQLVPVSPPGELTPDGFYRLITISDVRRDNNNNIVAAGGTVDPSTKNITITISWSRPFSSTISSTQYLTRYLENASYTQTTQTDFNAGTLTGVTVRATGGSSLPDDGEIILGAGGRGDWCSPNLSSSQINLTGGNATTVSAVEGHAYVGTGLNASGLPFINIAISNTNPPIATEIGTSTLNYKANVVAGDGNVGYIGTDTNSKEVVMINLATNPPYPEIGSFNAPPNGDAQGLVITANYGYVTVGSNLYNFRKYGDTTSPIDNDGGALTGTGGRVMVIGNYAYVQTKATVNQLNILDISNPTNLVRVGQLTVPGQAGKSLFVSPDGNRVYLVTGHQTTDKNEFFIINTQSKTNPTLVTGGTWDTSPMSPTSVAVVPGNYAIIGGWYGDPYLVLDISNENSPRRCGSLSASFGINDIATVTETDGDVYSYIVTNDSNGEFKIIAGGPGGTYSTSGVFESSTHNPGYPTANNRFLANFILPSSTTVRFQVAMASANQSGQCPPTGQYTFVGPDGTDSSYFTPISGQSYPFPYTSYQNYQNPGQCIRYRVYLSTTNGTNTPVINDVTINYSP